MWLSLLVANQKDPGFLAKNTDEYHRYVKYFKLVFYLNVMNRTFSPSFKVVRYDIQNFVLDLSNK